MKLSKSNLFWYWFGSFSYCCVFYHIQDKKQFIVGPITFFDVLIIIVGATLMAFIFTIPFAAYGLIRCAILDKKEETRSHLSPLLLSILFTHTAFWIPKHIPTEYRIGWIAFIPLILFFAILGFEINQLIKLKK